MILFFHPPRQHWEYMKTLDKNYDRSWLKGNDIFYNGVNSFIKKQIPTPCYCGRVGEKS